MFDYQLIASFLSKKTHYCAFSSENWIKHTLLSLLKNWIRSDCCWKISSASCVIPNVICFAIVLGRPAPFVAPPLDFLLGVSWMLFILFVFLQCSLKSMEWGFRPFPFAFWAFRPFCACVIWTWMWHLAQLCNRKHRLNTLLLLLRVQLATTYALGWVAVILKGGTPFDYKIKMRISFEINKCSSCLCSKDIRFFMR